MARVETKLPLANGLTLYVDRRGSDFYAIIGGWLVETIGGNLIVRVPGRPVNEEPLLKVPLRDAD